MSGNGSELFTPIVQSIAEHIAVKYTALHFNVWKCITAVHSLKCSSVNCSTLQITAMHHNIIRVCVALNAINCKKTLPQITSVRNWVKPNMN